MSTYASTQVQVRKPASTKGTRVSYFASVQVHDCRACRVFFHTVSRSSTSLSLRTQQKRANSRVTCDVVERVYLDKKQEVAAAAAAVCVLFVLLLYVVYCCCCSSTLHRCQRSHTSAPQARVLRVATQKLYSHRYTARGARCFLTSLSSLDVLLASTTLIFSAAASKCSIVSICCCCFDFNLCVNDDEPSAANSCALSI